MSVRGTLLVLTVALALLGTSCGGSSDENAVKIGVLADCGYLAQWREVAMAGAELPLLRRGGDLRGSRPLDGVEDAAIAGRPVELVLGCASDPTGGTVEARRLVEGEGVDLVVGLGFGTALVRYAAKQSGVTFVTDGTIGPGPNMFTFTTTAAQQSAGLGTYAYEELGWRRAVTIAEPDVIAWGEVAGFVAEFCSLGGEIVERAWLDTYPELPERIVTSPAKDVDGYYVASSPTQVRTDQVLERLRDLTPALAGHVIPGAAYAPADEDAVKRLGDDLVGLVTAWDIPAVAAPPALTEYHAEFSQAFPTLSELASQFSHAYDLLYHNAMEAVLRALEQVDADLSAGQTRFREALAAIHLEAPNGPIRLDENHQAVVPIYLFRIAGMLESGPAYEPLRTLDEVDASFGGRFGPGDPVPSRSEPPCESGHPPPWAAGAR